MSACGTLNDVSGKVRIMADVRVQIILHTANNVSEDYATNSWCVIGDDVAGQTTQITTAFKDFYDDIVVDLSATIAQNGHEAKFYDLPGTPPNYPFEEEVWNLASAPTGTSMPDEVAMCLSFQGTRIPGIPQARRRGRVYIGPLDISWLNTDGRPLQTRITNLANAATTLKSNLAALSPTVLLGVWSPTDGAAVAVNNGWIDNAWDTQRRRGRDATTRTLWT